MIRLLEEWRENLDKNYAAGGVLMDLSKAFDCAHMIFYLQNLLHMV